MNVITLCKLIAKRINPEYFILYGLDVKWNKPEYNTAENRAIVAEIISNYDTLAPELEREILIEKADSKRFIAYQQESDPLFFKAQRGEATLQEWQDKVNEIKLRFPYPEE